MLKAFQGKQPRIAPSAFVSEQAYIIGDVEIGEGSSVWPGAVLRSDGGKLTIGRNTHIEDNCVIHASRSKPLDIGDSVILGHGAVMNGRSIGSHVLVGINAAILDGAEIGDFCIVGAGAVVGERMQVPDGSIALGVPARVKGKVSPAQREHLAAPGRYFFDLIKQYKEEGFENPRS
ncbi:MAG: gamma carbonic anhydrase family protein [Chloroflexota bacterium]|nr:gamma carbonic anhydrase family protein [Chloroflexota bacterium]